MWILMIFTMTISFHHSLTRIISQRLSYRCFASLKINRSTDVVSSDSNEKIKIVKSLKVKKNRDHYNLILLEGYRY